MDVRKLTRQYYLRQLCTRANSGSNLVSVVHDVCLNCKLEELHHRVALTTVSVCLFDECFPSDCEKISKPRLLSICNLSAV